MNRTSTSVHFARWALGREAGTNLERCGWPHPVTAAASLSPFGDFMSSINAAAALSQLPPGALPATYVEQDPAQCAQAKVAHLFGILGILGTGINYYLKHKQAGPFVKDQMKEAFNF